jgi:hypothetical protein
VDRKGQFCLQFDEKTVFACTPKKPEDVDQQMLFSALAEVIPPFHPPVVQIRTKPAIDQEKDWLDCFCSGE